VRRRKKQKGRRKRGGRRFFGVSGHSEKLKCAWGQRKGLTKKKKPKTPLRGPVEKVGGWGEVTGLNRRTHFTGGGGGGGKRELDSKNWEKAARGGAKEAGKSFGEKGGHRAKGMMVLQKGIQGMHGGGKNIKN